MRLAATFGGKDYYVDWDSDVPPTQDQLSAIARQVKLQSSGEKAGAGGIQSLLGELGRQYGYQAPVDQPKAVKRANNMAPLPDKIRGLAEAIASGHPEPQIAKKKAQSLLDIAAQPKTPQYGWYSPSQARGYEASKQAAIEATTPQPSDMAFIRQGIQDKAAQFTEAANSAISTLNPMGSIPVVGPAISGVQRGVASLLNPYGLAEMGGQIGDAVQAGPQEAIRQVGEMVTPIMKGILQPTSIENFAESATQGYLLLEGARHLPSQVASKIAGIKKALSTPKAVAMLEQAKATVPGFEIPDIPKTEPKATPQTDWDAHEAQLRTQLEKIYDKEKAANLASLMRTVDENQFNQYGVAPKPVEFVKGEKQTPATKQAPRKEPPTPLEDGQTPITTSNVPDVPVGYGEPGDVNLVQAARSGGLSWEGIAPKYAARLRSLGVTADDLNGVDWASKDIQPKSTVKTGLDSSTSQLRSGKMGGKPLTDGQIASLVSDIRSTKAKLKDLGYRDSGPYASSKTPNPAEPATPTAKNSEANVPSDGAGKEPWQMTAEEIRRGGTKPQKPGTAKYYESLPDYSLAKLTQTDPHAVPEALKRAADSGFRSPTQWVTAVNKADDVLRSAHKDYVRNALSEGKPVPPEVLADYPDLAAKYEKTTSPSAKEPWQMTADEWAKRDWRKLRYDDELVKKMPRATISPIEFQKMSKAAQATLFESRRRATVYAALSEGKPVPPAVVDEFLAGGGKLPEKGLHPDLAAKYQSPKEVGTPQPASTKEVKPNGQEVKTQAPAPEGGTSDAGRQEGVLSRLQQDLKTEYPPEYGKGAINVPAIDSVEAWKTARKKTGRAGFSAPEVARISTELQKGVERAWNGMDARPGQSKALIRVKLPGGSEYNITVKSAPEVFRELTGEPMRVKIGDKEYAHNSAIRRADRPWDEVGSLDNATTNFVTADGSKKKGAPIRLEDGRVAIAVRETTGGYRIYDYQTGLEFGRFNNKAQFESVHQAQIDKVRPTLDAAKVINKKPIPESPYKWKPEDRSVVSLEQQNNAKIEIGPEKSVVTFLKEAPDATNAVHEYWHHATDQLFNGTTDVARSDQAIMEEWIGRKYKDWTRADLEKTARAGERYLTTGKAPNLKVKPVFERLKGWMQQVYRNISRSPIKAEVPDHITEVFDRWLGGKEDIPSGKKGIGIVADNPGAEFAVDQIEGMAGIGKRVAKTLIKNRGPLGEKIGDAVTGVAGNVWNKLGRLGEAGKDIAAKLNEALASSEAKTVQTFQGIEDVIKEHFGSAYRTSAKFRKFASTIFDKIESGAKLTAGEKAVWDKWAEASADLAERATANKVLVEHVVGEKSNPKLIGEVGTFVDPVTGKETSGLISKIGEDSWTIEVGDKSVDVPKWIRVFARQLVDPAKHVPRRLLPEIANQIAEKKGKGYEFALDWLQKTKQAKDRAAAQHILDIAFGKNDIELPGVGRVTLERPRLYASLPKELYDRDFLQVIKHHIARSNLRIAGAEQFGGGSFKGLAGYMDALGSEGHAITSDIQAALGATEIPSRFNRAAAKLSAAESTYTAITKLTGFVTGMKQVTQIASTVGVHGVSSSAKAAGAIVGSGLKNAVARIIPAIKRSEMVKMLHSSGAIDNDVLRLMGTEDVHGIMRSVTDTALTITGVKPLDTMARIHAAKTGEFAARAAARKLVLKNGELVQNAAYRYLHEWGKFSLEDLTDMAKRASAEGKNFNLTSRETMLANHAGVSSQVRTRIADMPAVHRTPVGRILMRLQSFNYGQSQILGFAVKEALKGNVTPLTRMTAAYTAAGYALAQYTPVVKSLLSGKPVSDKDKEGLAAWMLHNGMLGLYETLLPDSRPPRIPPAASSIYNITQAAGDIIEAAAKQDLPMDKAAKIAKDLARKEIVLVGRTNPSARK